MHVHHYTYAPIDLAVWFGLTWYVGKIVIAVLLGRNRKSISVPVVAPKRAYNILPSR